MEQERRIEITKNALIGQAVGDAFGVPVEFLPRETVRSLHIREMVGADSGLNLNSRWGDRIPRGSWSDDTSMTVASMSSFIQNKGRIDDEDQMKQFVRWWEQGEYCCLAYPFGLGGNIHMAMLRYHAGTPAADCGGKGFHDNGNGALMRILPFSLYCIFHHLDEAETVSVIGNGSALTHGHEISRMCCYIWTEFLRALTEGADVDAAISHIESIPYERWFSAETGKVLSMITGKKTRSLSEADIGETGYVVDTLFSALYSMYHASDFESAILNAVNLGYDTDTAGAVTGTAAGIRYGIGGIPPQWLNALRKRDELESLARDYAMCFDDQA